MITARQSQALTLTAGGMTRKEVARTMSLAPVTVEEHINRARRALKAKNALHAVAIAIRRGLI